MIGKVRRLGGVILTFIAFVVVCLSLSTAAHGKKTVVATTGMIADAVYQVGGDRINVTALMGPGVDPHTYRQTRSDIFACLLYTSMADA